MNRPGLLASTIAFAFLSAAPAMTVAQDESGQSTTPKADEQKPADAKPRVRMETSLGVIVLELDAEKAPISVANFLQYVDDGFYNGTIFHRVIPTFMIQGGGFTKDLVQKPTRSPSRTSGRTASRMSAARSPWRARR
jgi:hypothetical protein